MTTLQGKNLIITGAAGGIGSAICRRIAADGASICATDMTQEGLDRMAKSVGIGSDRLVTIPADITKREDVRKVVELAAGKFGSIHGIANVAMASTNKPIVEVTDADMELALNTGIWATFYFMQECYPYLKATRGSIVNFGSSAAIKGQPKNGSYAASKEAIRGLSRTAVNEWGPDGIRINIVLPFAVTPAMEQWAKDFPDLYRHAEQSVPLQRIGDPQGDIAPVVAWLLSDDSQYVTGQTIAVDGGNVCLP